MSAGKDIFGDRNPPPARRGRSFTRAGCPRPRTCATSDLMSACPRAFARPGWRAGSSRAATATSGCSCATRRTPSAPRASPRRGRPRRRCSSARSAAGWIRCVRSSRTPAAQTPRPASAGSKTPPRRRAPRRSPPGWRSPRSCLPRPGGISQYLPVDAMLKGILAANGELRREGDADFQQAIQTTDAFEKRACLEVELSGGPVRLSAQCKGAGMISPRFATMFCFVQTDAALQPATADLLLGVTVKRSFDRASVDGQLSTNDIAVLMCSGASGVKVAPGVRGRAALRRGARRAAAPARDHDGRRRGGRRADRARGRARRSHRGCRGGRARGRQLAAREGGAA